MKLIYTLAFILITKISIGQVLFNNTYNKPNYDYADAVIERQDGKYLVAGSSRSQAGTDYDVNILLVDSAGNLIWDKYLGIVDTLEFAYSLIETSNNNYLISGRIGNYFPYLLKFDANGTFIWDKRYGSNGFCLGGFSIGETLDSNYYFVRPDYSYNSTTFFKTNTQGDTLFTRSYNSIISLSVTKSFDNGFALVGNTNPTTFNQEIYLVKTNSIGDTLWTKTFGGSGNDDATSIQQVPDSGYIIAGIFDTQIPDEESDTYIIRTNSSGDTVWTKRYYHIGVPGYIKKCFNGEGYILSSTREVSGVFPHLDEYYLVITKIDTLGNIQWSRQFDGQTYTLGNNVTQTSDGGFLLTGNINGTITPADIILIKLDSVGNYVLSVKDVSNSINSHVLAFPNPASNEIYFALGTSSELIKQMKIINFLGEELELINGTNENHIRVDVKKLSAGIFIYELTTADNKIKMGKFIVRK